MLCLGLKILTFVDGTLQVTAGKGDLEKSLKLAKKLKKETAALEELIVAVDETLTEQETKKGPIDHEDQLRTLAVSYVPFVAVWCSCRFVVSSFYANPVVVIM